MTPNMLGTMTWLHDNGFLCKGCNMCTPVPTFTDDQKLEISQAFDAGSYANAYESNDLEDFELDMYAPHERAAFVLGFFGTHALHEIISDREEYDECYWSPAGRYVVTEARYIDSRDEEYAEDERASA